jgi:hypothetical protein
MMPGALSTPMVLPSGASFARSEVMIPGPHPTSRMFEFGLMCGRRYWQEV